MELEKIDIWIKDTGENSYELLDCGEGEKLERIGGEVIIRPEPRAWWQKALNKDEWNKATSIYKTEGQKVKWVFKGEEKEKEFDIQLGEIKSKIKIGGSSKHVGIFPEQYSEWQWIKEIIEKQEREVNVLNLFGYTGLASLFAAKAGAKVTHVDASETSIDWAKENQKLSGLESLPIRWILDDSTKFLKREIRRGVKYNAIIMDPPSFGRGPKGEVWKIEENIKELLEACKELLSEDPLFVIINMYSTELSSISLQNLMKDLTQGKIGNVIKGELVIKQKDSERLLPLSIFSIFSK